MSDTGAAGGFAEYGVQRRDRDGAVVLAVTGALDIQTAGDFTRRLRTVLAESPRAVVIDMTEGTALRLRPVLMTASVAILGLVPMLLSSGVGAETQRPLATVVVGGLLSSTLLTLVLLPVLYEWLETRASASTEETAP